MTLELTRAPVFGTWGQEVFSLLQRGLQLGGLGVSHSVYTDQLMEAGPGQAFQFPY